jgi:hypothetical protein
MLYKRGVIVMDKNTKLIQKFLRDMQGSSRHKGIDKLSRQYRQEEQLKGQLKK